MKDVGDQVIPGGGEGAREDFDTDFEYIYI